ncbi:MAG TPA: ABC transporter substrate-binding protein [Acidimicrobiales bacterium]|nr:ABC transporter substrate-binding protein [Acidimicrobiales bacterium]
MTRREFLRLAAGAGTAAALAPVLGASSRAGASVATRARRAGVSIPSSASIEVAWWGAEVRDARTEEVMNLFEKEHPGWKLTPFFSDFSDYFDAMNVRAAANDLPDVIQLGGSYVPQYADEGQLLSLDRYSVGDPLDRYHNGTPLDLTGFDDSQLLGGTVHNHLYAVTLGGNMPAVVYNKSMLARAGVKPPPVGYSWSDFQSYLSALKSKLPSGVYPCDDNSGTGGPVLSVWALQKYKRMYTSSGQLAFGVGELEEYFQYWASLRQQGLIVPGTLEAAAIQNGTNNGNPLVLGQAAFTFIYSNYLSQYQPLTSDQLGLIRYPLGPKGSLVGDFTQASQFFSVSSHSKAPYVAADFINFCVNNPHAIEALGVERGIPAAVRNLDIVLKSPRLVASDRAEVRFESQYGPLTRPQPVAPAKSGALTDIWQNAAQDIALGTASVAQASEQAMSLAATALS